ncbi:MAG: hypothetical protein CMJ86_05700 [Planctomycetes bacterium]|nr:hypothetical protein [Planctomycetota bacterium]
MVFSCTPEGVLEYLSPVAMEAFGLEPEGCTGRNLGDLLHEDCPQGPENLRRFLRGDSASDLPRLCLAAGDGSPRWIELRLTNSTQNPLVGTLHDVTEIVRIEEERAELDTQLIERNAELRAQAVSLSERTNVQAMLVRISQDFVQAHTIDTGAMIDKALSRIGSFMRIDRARVFYLSDDGQTMNRAHDWFATGMDPEVDRVRGLDVADISWLIAQLRAGRAIHIPRVCDLPAEAFGEKKALQGVQSYIALPMTSQGELQGYIAFAAVREERSWEPELVSVLQLVGNMFQSARVRQRVEQLKGEFVASVSHELRTPLTSILGFAQTLARKPDLDLGTRKEFVDIIKDQSVRLQTLIESLLEISRIESGNRELGLEDVDLGEFVQSTCSLLQASAAAGGIAFTVDIQSDTDHRTQVDIKRMRSVVENLVGNAIKFTPRDGTVLVKVSTEGDAHLVTVQDNGFGIPLTEHEQIFDRFYRVQQPGREIQGTGLGLAITKEIVESHGGTVQVKSAAGEGATFTVSLPRRPAQA